MNVYVLPENIVADLQRSGGETQLCDAAGRKLGFFVPLVPPGSYEADEPDLSDEELQKIKKSTKWYTTDEVLAHLARLP